MNEPDPLELASLIAETLERCQIRYIFGGSLASTALGEPRATLDVDIVVDLSPETVGPWLSLLGSDFSFDEEWARDEVTRRGSFQLIHLPTMTRIDVFVPAWEGVHLWKCASLVRPRSGVGAVDGHCAARGRGPTVRIYRTG